MPIYMYKCEICKKEHIYTHNSNDSVEKCPNCGGILKKIPSFLAKNVNQKSKVGEYTNHYIEKAKEDIEQLKESLKKKQNGEY